MAGILLGTALGDALGLPHEGLSPGRIARRFDRGALRHWMLPGRGLLSDDTEHTSMVARALAESSGDPDRFTRSLARQLRRWLLGLPPGLGLATLRGTIRLLLGIDPASSGVRSAGNGPAMRSALLGACARDDAHLVELVRASTRMTHTDPRALDGALVVARLARDLAEGRPDPAILDEVACPDFRRELARAWHHEVPDIEAYRVAAGFESGVSGFVVHTVPAAIWCALHRGEEPALAIEAAIRLGGDTDTTGAIVGALVGARHGAGGLPGELLSGIRDFPLTLEVLGRLADAVVSGREPPPQRPLAALARNLAFVPLLLGHVGLRLFGR